MKQHILLLLMLLLPPLTASAEQVYMEPDSFVRKHLPDAPDAKSLWVTGALREQVEEVLEHRPLALRQRYWQDGNLTLWILEEIGKEEPITAGFAVRDGQIIDTQVLIFRESRGWEIRYPSFTAQFENMRMTESRQLERSIDGISGATLSVNAMRKLARLALTLDHHITTSSHADLKAGQKAGL